MASRRPRPAAARPAARQTAGGAFVPAGLGRVLAPVIGAALALGGCSTTNPITTNVDYAASDGLRVDLGDLRMVNLLVLSSEQGAPGAVLGGISNRGSEDVDVTVGVAAGEEVTFSVAAGETVLLGPGREAEVVLPAIPEAPGGLVPMTLGSQRDGQAVYDIPVLDGTLPEYSGLVPDPED